MQNTANATTVLSRIITAARAALVARPAALGTFSVDVPGLGRIGAYATAEDAESALSYLPYSARQRATISGPYGACVRR